MLLIDFIIANIAYLFKLFNSRPLNNHLSFKSYKLPVVRMKGGRQVFVYFKKQQSPQALGDSLRLTTWIFGCLLFIDRL